MRLPVASKRALSLGGRYISLYKNSTKSGSGVSKIASCTLNLIDSKHIINDLHLICAFHTFFLFPHFGFLQLGDPKAGNTASFQARHMAVQYFLMLEDLLAIDNDWERKEQFGEYVRSLEELNDDDKAIQKKKKFTHFTRYVRKSLIRYFKRWTRDLFFMSLFLNHPTPSINEENTT